MKAINTIEQIRTLLEKLLSDIEEMNNENNELQAKVDKATYEAEDIQDFADAVQDYLDSDGSRGAYDAVLVSDARKRVETLIRGFTRGR